MNEYEPFESEMVIPGKAIRVKMQDRFLSDWSPVLQFFNEQLRKHIVQWELDLRGSRQICSMGIGALIVMHTKCKIHQGGGFTLIIEPGGGIYRLLSLSRLMSVLNVRLLERDEALEAPDMEAALNEHGQEA